jgi:hypothetical protein
MLDHDITRCRGEGNAGQICASRNLCLRFLAIAEDVAREESTGLRFFHSYAGMLCKLPRWPFFWPIE